MRLPSGLHSAATEGVCIPGLCHPVDQRGDRRQGDGGQPWPSGNGGKAGSKKQGLSILEAGGMTKKELSRVTDKETREAWGLKWAGVAGSAPCKDAALKSANRNEFHWSAEASALFQDAVTELGGLSLANRKSICDLSDSPARTPSPPNLSSGSKSPAEGQAAGSCCHQPAANARCGTCSARTKEAEYICSRWVDG
jgi:hypothetical protein